MAVTFPSHGESAQNLGVATTTLSSVVLQVGDILVVWQSNGNATQDYPTSPSVSGGPVVGAWANINASDGTNQTSRMKVWYATVTTGGTASVLVTGNTSGLWGAGYLVVRGSSGVGVTVNSIPGDTTGPSVATGAGTASGSALVGFYGDWTADDTVHSVWRTIDGYTPATGTGSISSGNANFAGGLVYEYGDHTNYGVRIAYWNPTTSGGAKTTGFTTGSTTLRITAAVLEFVAAPLVPTAPTNVVATPSVVSTSVNLSWTAPASDGGSAITNYIVTPYITGVAQATQSVGSAATSFTATGLTTDTSYTFTVKAVNANGTGPESAQSNAIRPTASANTGYGDGSYGSGSYGVRSAADSTAPIPTVGTITASKISRVAGKDSTDVSWTTDENFVEYEIRRVSSSSDGRGAGTQVETATVTARSSHTATLTDDELVAASSTEGSNLLKVFVKDAAGNWST